LGKENQIVINNIFSKGRENNLTIKNAVLFCSHVHNLFVRLLPIANIVFNLFSELEALEACYWLKAAGFPQYSQAYEGNALLSQKKVGSIKKRGTNKHLNVFSWSSHNTL